MKNPHKFTALQIYSFTNLQINLLGPRKVFLKVINILGQPKRIRLGKKNQEIYEKMNPKTKKGIIGGLKGGRGRIANESDSDAISFVKDTSEKTNVI